jgi:hypothetical protein
MEQIQSHPFFEGINWKALRKHDTPFVPKLDNDADTAYFDIESKSPPRFAELATAAAVADQLIRVESSPAIGASRTLFAIPKIKVKELDEGSFPPLKSFIPVSRQTDGGIRCGIAVEKENRSPNSQRLRPAMKVPLTAPKPQAAVSRLPVASQTAAKKKRNSDRSQQRPSGAVTPSPSLATPLGTRYNHSHLHPIAASISNTSSSISNSRFNTPLFKTPTKIVDPTSMSMSSSPDREILGFTFKRPRAGSVKSVLPDRPRSLISQKLNFDSIDDDMGM